MKLIDQRFILFVIFTGIVIIFSGCISQQKDNTTIPITNVQHQSFQTSPSHSPATTHEGYWIRIDPCKDYKTDSSFNITGSSILNISGTTNFPPGTILNLVILEENRYRDVFRTTIEIRGNISGPNSFFYVYDMKGNPPGQYRTAITDSVNSFAAVSRFNVITDVPYYKRIRINPIGDMHVGDNITISGTTDMPAGSEIRIRTGITAHSCTIPTPDKEGQRTFCGGSCQNTGSSQKTALVTEDRSGINTWNSTIDTTGWCPAELYWINADAPEWANVTLAYQTIEFKN